MRGEGEEVSVSVRACTPRGSWCPQSCATSPIGFAATSRPATPEGVRGRASVRVCVSVSVSVRVGIRVRVRVRVRLGLG